MKNLKNLGTTLSKVEQKKITGSGSGGSFGDTSHTLPTVGIGAITTLSGAQTNSLSAPEHWLKADCLNHGCSWLKNQCKC
ncbi:hypothetical protein [Psychroserpens sp. NJDZ02]|uniref:hypothetical protein n=1 Tax=Psychroserpens sp. NJDZ02 TaxID=2570561 RepID=UPI0010A76F38|nr:hypothetical protein [Psychroserpens sp. NJDZ02]QCE40402.1 hypothetical protein E9099_02890 [Psychroserpens sp. NJDZ02]